MPKTARQKAKARQAAYDKKRRQKAKEKGFCTSCCKQEAAKGKKKCNSCLKYFQKRRKKAKDKGLCISCCKQERAKGKARCIGCLEYMKQNYEEAKAQDNVCVKCHKEKPESEFISLHCRREEKTQMCRACRDKQHEYEHSDRSALHRQRVKFNAIRAKQECSVCGEDDSDVLEADHVRGTKVKPLSEHQHWYKRPEKEFDEELEKIDWKCGYCHALKTKSEWKEQKNKRIRRNRKIMNEYKVKVGQCCARCSRPVTFENCVAFDFDHLDPKTKKYTISRLVKKSKKTFDDNFLPEAKKCQIVCHSCHKKITDKQRKRKRQSI